jgi:hypothetical protein
VEEDGIEVTIRPGGDPAGHGEGELVGRTRHKGIEPKAVLKPLGARRGGLLRGRAQPRVEVAGGLAGQRGVARGAPLRRFLSGLRLAGQGDGSGGAGRGVAGQGRPIGTSPISSIYCSSGRASIPKELERTIGR